MTKAEFEQPTPAQITDAMEYSRQIRSDAMAEMVRGLWTRIASGASNGVGATGKMADC